MPLVMRQPPHGIQLAHSQYAGQSTIYSAHLLPGVTIQLKLLHSVTQDMSCTVRTTCWEVRSTVAIPRILVVEDDQEMRQMLTHYLQQKGIVALPAKGESDVRKHFNAGRIDLILLDVMLGDESGIDICAKLREEHNVPIIMVSALSTDQQRMAGYAVGADDYIAKPFNIDLMMARIKAVLARTQRAASLSHRRKLSSFEFAGWTFDARTSEVTAPGGYQVSLSQRELALLQALLANPHIPLTREEIAAALAVTSDAQSAQDVTGRAIDMLVGRLRAKMERNPKKPEMLKTQRGVGYVFAVDVVTVEQ